ncbi:predicted protein [Postia placenta Mad-698-R]|nr:predicted protein [Postia placenta Mad-698-R]
MVSAYCVTGTSSEARSGKDPDVELSRASKETSEESRTKGAPILVLIRRDYTAYAQQVYGRAGGERERDITVTGTSAARMHARDTTDRYLQMAIGQRTVHKVLARRLQVRHRYRSIDRCIKGSKCASGLAVETTVKAPEEARRPVMDPWYLAW